MSNERQSACSVIYGTNGTGKSTYVRNKMYPNARRALVVTETGAPKIWREVPEIDPTDAHAMETFTGWRQVKSIMLGRNWLDIILKYYRNGLLILDDCRNSIGANIDNTPGLRRLLGDFRHNGLDVCFVVHGPDQIPKQVWTFTTHIAVGKCPSVFQKGVVDPEIWQEINTKQRQINSLHKYFRKKNDPRQYGLFFPIDI